MITNFEEETCPLTSEEHGMVDPLVEILRRVTKNNPIKSDHLCAIVNHDNPQFRRRITGPRLRKITNYIRSNGILPIIATSQGYYTSYDKNEIRLQIKSLQERADAIRNSAEGLKLFLEAPTDLFGYPIYSK